MKEPQRQSTEEGYEVVRVDTVIRFLGILKEAVKDRDNIPLLLNDASFDLDDIKKFIFKWYTNRDPDKLDIDCALEYFNSNVVPPTDELPKFVIEGTEL